MRVLGPISRERKRDPDEAIARHAGAKLIDPRASDADFYYGDR